MTLKEVFHILETEKFDNNFNKTSLYNKVMLIMLRKVFSEYFFISEDNIYKTRTYVIFFNSLICKKENINIEKIKLDIYNKIPILTLAVKYLEPIEVIEEIKENIDKDISILKNKIYTSIELSSIFNLHSTTITANKILNKTCIKNNNGSIIFWLGHILHKNLDDIAKNSSLGNMSTNLVPLKKLYKHIDLDPSGIREKIKKGNKLFGVDLTYAYNGKSSKSKITFIKKEDYEKILYNKKFYIKIEDVKKEINVVSTTEKAIINNYYDFIYNDKIELREVWVKKETISKLLEIINLYKNRYHSFIDNLYQYIKQHKDKNFIVKDILLILPRTSSLKIIVQSFKIENGFITKKDALFLIDQVKASSYNYKKSKQQGETNG